MQIVIWWFSYSSFRIFISLGQLVEEKSPSIFQFTGKDILKGTKGLSSVPHFAFLLISKSHQRCRRHYSNLEKSPPVLIFIVLPIFLLQHFELSIIIPIMRSMNYFGQVILEILENNQLRSYFGNSEIVILSPFLEIS